MGVCHAASAPSAPLASRRRGAIGRALLVGLLIGGTSYVIAGWVAAALVPVYLLAMALILLPITPTGARRRGRGGSGSPPGGADPADALTLTPADAAQATAAQEEAAEAHPEPPGTEGVGSAAAAPKGEATAGRRGRGRSRKSASKATADPVALPPATWVEVSPGKFVRADPAGLVPTDHSPAPTDPPPDSHAASDSGPATTRDDSPAPLTAVVESPPTAREAGTLGPPLERGTTPVVVALVPPDRTAESTRAWPLPLGTEADPGAESAGPLPPTTGLPGGDRHVEPGSLFRPALLRAAVARLGRKVQPPEPGRGRSTGRWASYRPVGRVRARRSGRSAECRELARGRAPRRTHQTGGRPTQRRSRRP